jgi:hypothetical protein
MAHSFTISAFHIVFSTKHRKPLIPPETQPILWKYLAGIARNPLRPPSASALG